MFTGGGNLDVGWVERTLKGLRGRHGHVGELSESIDLGDGKFNEFAEFIDLMVFGYLCLVCKNKVIIILHFLHHSALCFVEMQFPRIQVIQV